MIHVSRFGVIVNRAAHVAGAVRFAHFCHPWPVTIIEHPRLVQWLQITAGSDRRGDDFERFVIRRNQQHHPQPLRQRIQRSRCFTVDVPQRYQLQYEPG